MKVIQAWLNSTADSRHSRREDPSRRLPGRLIDVSLTNRVVKLMEREDCTRKDEPKDLSYLALSHCWGASKFLTLTNSNYPSFCQGLDLALLSKTFQHAISVCRRLGFRFIWIDSLCIIQDSAEDWLKESVMMQDVYRYAELTIAASSAWDSSEGLFVDQHPLPLSPCLVGFVAEDRRGPARGLYAMPRICQARYSWERDVKYSRLNNGAWVLQEQIMSPNVVYFGETQLHWKTGTTSIDRVDTISDSQLAILSEDVMFKPRTQNSRLNHYLEGDDLQADDRGPTQPPYPKPKFRWWWPWPRWWWGVMQFYFMRTFITTERTFLSDDSRPVSLQSIDQEAESYMSRPYVKPWWDLIEIYTRRSLTKRGDKLVAIAGVAALILREVGGDPSPQFLAGLWSETLVAGLLWYVNGKRKSSRPPLYLAPSWSWVSVEGTIANDSVELDPSSCGIEVLEKTVNGPIVNNNTIPDTAEVKSHQFPLFVVTEGSSIRIRGKLALATWQWPFGQAGKLYYAKQTRSAKEKSDTLWKESYLMRASDLYSSKRPGSRLKTSRDPVHPISQDSAAGVDAARMMTIEATGNKEVGWFLPDTLDDIPEQLHCLQIRVEPTTQVFKNDPLRLWVVRGLALTPTGRSPNEFRRVGYIELERTDKGLTYPDILTGALSHRNAYEPIRKWPNVDPHGFFGDGCEERELVVV